MSYRPVQRITRPCTFCGMAFTPRRRDAKYCSSSCCTQAHYAQNGRPKSRLQLAKLDTSEQKEVGFGKLMGAAAAANVAIEVTETLLDIGKAAQINKLQQELRQVHQKIDFLLKEKDTIALSSLSINDLFNPSFPQELPVQIKVKNKTLP